MEEAPCWWPGLVEPEAVWRACSGLTSGLVHHYPDNVLNINMLAWSWSWLYSSLGQESDGDGNIVMSGQFTHK